MTYIVKGSELVLIGDVGDLGDGLPFFTAADVRAGLAKVGRNTRATVRLNSGGGSATEGAAIASAFASHPGKVTCVVEGVAASAASVAACGADRVEMALGAVWMLHEASALTIGTAEAHEATVAGLEAINGAMAGVYSRKSGIPVPAVLDMMATETWMTADQACDAGFADAIMGETEPRPPARFAYAARYKRPPAMLLERLPKATAAGLELELHGRVGRDGSRASFTAASVVADLAKLRGRGPVTVSLNSTGGNSVEGRAISAALNAHPDGVEVVVEGTALSAAAFIACSAARSAIAPGSTLMLHRGAIDRMTADRGKPENRVRLDALDRAAAQALANRSGKPLAEIERMLKAETWFTADEAVAAGFIDRVVGQSPKAKAPRRPAPPVIADDEPLAPAEVVELCLAAEQPEVASELIRASATLPQARARLDVMATIRPMVAMAGDRGGMTAAFKAEMLSGRLTVAQVRERIFDAMADQSEAPEAAVDHHRNSNAGAVDGRALMKRSMEKLVAKKYGPDALKPKEKRT